MYLEREKASSDRIKHAATFFLIGVLGSVILGIISYFLPGDGLIEADNLVDLIRKTWFIPLLVGSCFSIYGAIRGEKAHDVIARFFEFFT